MKTKTSKQRLDWLAVQFVKYCICHAHARIQEEIAKYNMLDTKAISHDNAPELCEELYDNDDLQMCLFTTFDVFRKEWEVKENEAEDFVFRFSKRAIPIFIN